MPPSRVELLRRVGIVLSLLLIAFAAVQSAMVEAWSDKRPDLAAAAWPTHPSALLSSSLAEIGRAAARGSVPTPSTLQAVGQAARKAPLAPEPLLIAGTAQLSKGAADTAEPLLLRARALDPRAIAPRLLLADLYLRQRRLSMGLAEIAALSRLSPDGPGPVVQLLANYAREPGSAEPLAGLFRQRADLRDPVLTSLAADPGMADRVLALAGTPPSPGPWRSVLVDALVRGGRVAEARAWWARFTGDRTPSDRLVAADFKLDREAIPPFDWTYATRVGIAEARSDGLTVIAYGREDGVLASQLMTLPPGRYVFRSSTARVTGEADALHWTLTCSGASREILRAPVAVRSDAAAFEVPANCPVQQLALSATASQFGRASEATVRQVALEPASR